MYEKCIDKIEIVQYFLELAKSAVVAFLAQIDKSPLSEQDISHLKKYSKAETLTQELIKSTLEAFSHEISNKISDFTALDKQTKSQNKKDII
jgi:hypothetical protein